MLWERDMFKNVDFSNFDWSGAFSIGAIITIVGMAAKGVWSLSQWRKEIDLLHKHSESISKKHDLILERQQKQEVQNAEIKTILAGIIKDNEKIIKGVEENRRFLMRHEAEDGRISRTLDNKKLA